MTLYRNILILLCVFSGVQIYISKVFINKTNQTSKIIVNLKTASTIFVHFDYIEFNLIVFNIIQFFDYVKLTYFFNNGFEENILFFVCCMLIITVVTGPKKHKY